MPAPERRYLRIEGADGVPLNVLEIGDPAKPTVVLVHGIGQSHASFDAQFSDAVLTGALHVIAYDLRGHGQSGKPWTRDAYVTSEKWADDLARVIEHVHKEKVVVLGWSYGSLVVSDYLRKYGTRQLAAIALAGAYGGLTPPPPPPKEPPSPNFAADMKRMLEEQQSGDPAVRAAAIHRGVLRLTGKPMPGEWVAKSDVMGMLTATEARRYMFDRSLDNRDLVAKINVPLLVFIGGKDGSTPEAQGRELAAQRAAQAEADAIAAAERRRLDDEAAARLQEIARKQEERRAAEREAEAAKQAALNRIERAGPVLLGALKSVRASGAWSDIEDNIREAVERAIEEATGQPA